MLFSTSLISASPTTYWLEPGVYAEYPISQVLFTNETLMDASLFRWECKEVRGDIARLEFILVLLTEQRGREVKIRKVVLVNTQNNSLYLPGSRPQFVGTTALWLQPLLEVNTKSNLMMNPDIRFGPFRLMSTMYEVVEQSHAYGVHRQRAYEVNFKIYFEVGGKLVEYIDYAVYDYDTGVLLGLPPSFEISLMVLGVRSTGVGGIETVRTNIDLGPPTLLLNPMDVLIFVPVAIFVLIFGTLVFMKVRRKRRRYKRFSHRG